VNVLTNDTDTDTSDVLFVQSINTVGTLGSVVSNGNGTFTYNPVGQFDALAVGDSTTDTFTYVATDGNGGSTASILVTITITAVNDNPVADDESFTLPEAGVATEADLDSGSTLLDGDTDVDSGDTLTASWASNGTYGIVTVGPTGTFTYTHDGSENFSDSFTYTVTDNNGGTGTGTVNVTITEVNENAPVAEPKTMTLPEGTTGTNFLVEGDSLLSGVTDIDTTDSHTTSKGSDPTYGTVLVNGTGGFSYTHDDSENFLDSFTYIVTDAAGNTDTETVTITITEVNDNDPVADPESFTVVEGMTATEADLDSGTSLLDGDTDVDTTDTQTASKASDPSFGSVTVNADGTFSYTHDGTENLADSFTYTVTDAAGATDTETVTITVTPVNDNTPVATSDSFSLDEGTTESSYNVLANDTDADAPGDTLTVVEVEGSAANVGVPVVLAAGTLTVNSDGSLTYVAAADITVETFSDSFTYAVSDGVFTVTGVPVTITINPVNDNSPTALPTSDETVAEDAADSVISLLPYFSDLDIDADGILDADTAADQDSLIFTLASNSNGSMVVPTISGSDLTLDYQLNQNGSAIVVITATDNAGNSVDNPVNVIVTPVNDNPTLDGTVGAIVKLEDADPFVVDWAGVFNDVDIATNADVLTYSVNINESPDTWVITTLFDVPAVVFDSTTDNTTITLTPHASGTSTITIDATDSGGLTVGTLTIDITVTAQNDDIPVAVDDTYTMLEDGGVVLINVLQNDNIGDGTTTVTAAGTTLNVEGVDESWRSTLGSADPFNSGSIQIANGQVHCAGCADASAGSALVSGAGLPGNVVFYLPRDDFNGTDSFDYTITDSDGQSSTATVTITVQPVNDVPDPAPSVSFSMDQDTVLSATVAAGLGSQVTDRDNTHIDGLGCDPVDPACTPTGDTLYYQIVQASTPNAELDAPYCCDGAFVYRPDGDFSGIDTFTFDVCDRPFADATVENCTFGVVASITVNAIAGAPEGSVDEAVEFDYQLSQTPLELPVPSLPNVLLMADDSESMNFDILTDQADGVYWYDNGDSVNYIMPGTLTSATRAPSEEAAPGEGLWRLRNKDYNVVYYNPAIRYEPWEGLDSDGNTFINQVITDAYLNPWIGNKSNNKIDLTAIDTYNASAPATSTTECNDVCVTSSINNPDYPSCTAPLTYDPCTLKVDVTVCENVCTTITGGGNVTSNVYLPHYYTWDDKDSDGEMDATPSPFSDPDNSEGILVEIKSAAAGGSDTYPKGTGRTDCVASGSSCSLAEEMANFANWYSYARDRSFVFKSSIGQVIAEQENIRVGYSEISGASNNLPIAEMNESPQTGNKLAVLNHLYTTAPQGGTPLRTALDDAGRYFECTNGNIMRETASNPGDPGCPVLAVPEGNCQQNFTLVLTDGAWTGTEPNIDSPDSDLDTDFDGGRYADTDPETLADVAMYWYERDLHPDLADEVPVTARDLEGADISAFGGNGDVMHQHMSTYVIGFGVEGTITADDVPTDYTQAMDWGDPVTEEAKINDLRHAAVNSRGDYLSAGDPQALLLALEAAFAEMSEGIGTASAVSFNSQEILEGSLVFRAFYNVKDNTGDLVAQGFSEAGLDEDITWSAAEAMDTLSNVYDDREIITYDPVTKLGIPFRSASLNTAQFNSFVEDPDAVLTDDEKAQQVLDRVNYLRGDDSLERPTGIFRERPVEKGRIGDIVHSTPVFVGPPDRLNRNAPPYPQASPYSTFKGVNVHRQKMIYVSANDGMFHGFKADTGEEVFAYVPNHLMLGTFSRKMVELLNFNYSHKYFVDTTPAINDVFMSPTGGDDRKWMTIAVGGHGAGAKAYFAIDLSNPGDVSPGTASNLMNEANAGPIPLWEFTDADDTYPVDAAGVPLKNDDSSFKEDLQSTPQYVKDLGYSYSVPTLVMSNVLDGPVPADPDDPQPNQEWVAIMGNGFNSTSGIAKLFVLFLNRGADGDWCHPDMNQPTSATPTSDCTGKQDFVKLDTQEGVPATGEPGAGYPNGLGTPRGIDVDGNATIDYAYAGDALGNFYRFDMRSSDFNEWKVQKIFQATYTGGKSIHPDIDDADGCDGCDEHNIDGIAEVQPIFNRPLVVEHPSEEEGYIVIFATGSYITDPDRTDTHVQSIYGIWDRLGPTLIQKSDLVQQRYTNVNDTTLGKVRTLSDENVDYSADGGKRGWYNDLDAPQPGSAITEPAEFPGERAIRNIQLRGGIVFVNSVAPRSVTSCTTEAGGFGLAFCPGNGGLTCLGSEQIFDVNNDGTYDASDKTGGSVVAGIIFENSAPTDAAFIGGGRVTQLSDQSLDIQGTNTSGGADTGRLSWKRLDATD
jgi:type IV pilus assembly protein PilY1